MSYQIYYDRAFIRVGDKFIPLANSGSNNCWEYSGNRDIPEKNWSVLNWKHEYQFVFSESEIKKLARIYDQHNQESGIDHKSRNQCFESGEFERWIINGMKNAYTVEEYVSFGNDFYVSDYSADDTRDWKKYSFKTTDGLLKILDDLKDIRSKDIKLGYNREVFRPKVKRASKKVLRAADLSEYYVLKGDYNERTIYFIKLNRKGGFKYLSYFTRSQIKVFRAEKDALAYLKKYQWVFEGYNFIPEKIINVV
jgi:hypothetical protein